jgi:hypothetical protein
MAAQSGQFLLATTVAYKLHALDRAQGEKEQSPW